MRGGEGGIRTHGELAPTPHFECGAFDLSATSPRGDDLRMIVRSASGRSGPVTDEPALAKRLPCDRKLFLCFTQ